ncbi:hypothetical protein Deipr_1860 [Deinococcus proteolyticus MRP]|uniref:Uncharacterized protein n=1 Tax=Deinococcus proteolyticus (strain ATCC 35074 / DSM 20540 / JCM 6276 / NBRC 101906 / NCIMB 13154 / VKM Ac-1939 / CCM 2703 / MRP) TaxID=693977 RepID=F0RLY2_DEIPM|nr:hypothetical protein [Deinococcus proteolyticus]ADY26992.1 hypothetical protein Deipr_1860 [Deinococcus proteolyticus MRP]
MNPVLSRIPVKMLGDVLSTRALERIIQDAAQERRVHPAQLDAQALESVLKKDIYRRLQLSLPAKLAKKRVLDVLGEVQRVAAEVGTVDYVPADLSGLEEGVRRFTLYFDWPESQRLRGVLNMARQEESVGNDVSALLQEGESLIEQMDRRLAEGLVAQGQDLAELRATFERVSAVGGREVRRLETLLEQVDDAQKQGMLLPGEVERARTLSLKLRRQLESSVVQNTPGDAQPDPAAEAKLRALELELVGRRLGDVLAEFSPLIGARPELEAHAAALNDALAGGTLTEQAVADWQQDLSARRGQLRSEQQAQLAELERQLAELPASGEAEKARVTLGLARHTLEEGGLAADELRDLALAVQALQSSPGGASETLRQQRELSELERSARDVSGAGEELAPQIAQARERLQRGEDVDIDALYAVLERRMGQAAQEREGLDARADHVVREYDSVRDLAGETIQKLGRLADTLRAQRRLGQLSVQARERYLQTLTEAEALLDEARAEHAAAQEVTASFGEDALSGLLDIFDLESAESGLFDVDASEPEPGSDLLVGGKNEDEDLRPGTGTGSGDSAGAAGSPGTAAGADTGGFNPFAFLSGTSAAASHPADSLPAAASAEPGDAAPPPLTEAQHLPEHAWLIAHGRRQAGQPDHAAERLAPLLQSAAELGITRLRFEDGDWSWSARQSPAGTWRLARAADAATLELNSGAWLKQD